MSDEHGRLPVGTVRKTKPHKNLGGIEVYVALALHLRCPLSEVILEDKEGVDPQSVIQAPSTA